MSKAVYLGDMETGGMVRCAECGYKNSPVYHYCGVCGAVLHPAEPVKAAAPANTARTASPATPVPPAPVTPLPVSAAPPEVTTPPPSPFRPEPSVRPEPSSPPDSSLTGMSFLGLSQPSSSSSTDYLLEEEETGKRTWGRFVFIVLLLAVAGGLGWQWKHGGYPFVRTSQMAATTPAQPVQNPAPAAPDTTQPAANTPLITAEAPSTQAATPEPTPTQPAATEPAKPAETNPDATAEAKPAETKPAETKPAEAKPAEAKPAIAKAQPPVAKPAAPAEPAVSPGESLFRQGQKYLYGTGVPTNCDLALKSLTAAAARNHPQAQSTMGTMYFTGHCVTRDLPLAYRWFAKALKQDPANTRLEQNLNVVWRQMTPEERQVAMQAQ